jgi:hypothetical protein
MGEWTIGAVLDAIADVIPDRPMTVCGDRVSTFSDYRWANGEAVGRAVLPT